MKENMPQPKIKKYLMGKAALKRMPLSGNFELTPLCNMNCRMCYIRMTKEEMEARGTMLSAEDWLALGREAVSKGMLFLLFTGGEPFIRPDFRYIYTELVKMGLSVSINSNGTIIDEEIISWLKENPPSRVNVTLYGGSNETYERLCGLKNGYDKAVRGIELLREAGIMVFINASFTKYNVDDMAEIMKFAAERNIMVNSTSYMFPPVRSAKDGKTDDEVRFTPEEAAMSRAESERLRLSPEEYEVIVRRVHAGVCSFEENDECVRSEDAKMRCMAGKGSFWVTWDGRITPCGMMNTPVANYKQGNFEECWKYIVESTDKICTPVECENCEKRFACSVCGALVMAESGGDTTVKPEYLCGLTANYIKIMEERYAELEKK